MIVKNKQDTYILHTFKLVYKYIHDHSNKYIETTVGRKRKERLIYLLTKYTIILSEVCFMDKTTNFFENNQHITDCIF